MISEETVCQWFDAFDAPDMDRARSLVSPDAIFHVEPSGPVLHGFREMLDWNRERSTDDSFSYTLDPVRGQADYAVAFLTLRSGRKHAPWRQTAVYHAPFGRINQAWLFEDARDDIRA